jgi:hypothetical protein
VLLALARRNCNWRRKSCCLTGEGPVRILTVPFADWGKFEHRTEGGQEGLQVSESMDELCAL